MEDTLRVAKGPCYANNASVLILVLMEDTLRVRRGSDAVAEYKS